MILATLLNMIIQKTIKTINESDVSYIIVIILITKHDNSENYNFFDLADNASPCNSIDVSQSDPANVSVVTFSTVSGSKQCGITPKNITTNFYIKLSTTPTEENLDAS